MCVPYLVLAEEEGQQHQQSPVMDDPPHVDCALPETILIGGEAVHVLGHQQGLMGRRGLPHSLCREIDSIRVHHSQLFKKRAY